MLYKARELAANNIPGAMVKIIDQGGTPITNVLAANTEEGWLDLYVLRPTGTKPRVFVDAKVQEPVVVRIHTSFDVVHRNGNLLHTVRWSLTKGRNKKPTTRDFPVVVRNERVVPA